MATGSTTEAPERPADEQLFLPRKYIDFRDLTKERGTDPDDTMIRVYGGSACVTLQLRAGNTGLGWPKEGKPRRMNATASYLTQEELKQLVKALQAFIVDDA